MRKRRKQTSGNPRLLGAVLAVLALPTAGLSAFDLDISPPQFIAIPGVGTEGLTILNNALAFVADEFEQVVNNDLSRFERQDRLVHGFANAGASGAFVGFSLTRFRPHRFALAVGLGAAVSFPGIDGETVLEARRTITEEGDVYVGASVHPLTLGVGIDLRRYVDGLYVNAKVGYAVLDQRTIAVLPSGFSAAGISAGVLAYYRIVDARRWAPRLVLWHGLTFGSGLAAQWTRINLRLRSAATTRATTAAEIGLNEYLDVQATDVVGTLTVSPSFDAAFASETLSVPMELSTGFRLLALVDLRLGFGVDLGIGRSEVLLEARSDVDFVNMVDQFDLDVDVGSLAVRVDERGSGQQRARPRVTAAMGINLGNLWFSLPATYSFDAAGTTLMVSAVAGVMW